MNKLEHLKALCEEATQGEWEAYFAFGSSDLPCEIRNEKDNTIVVWDESCDGHCTADARFISQCNPQTVLKLLSIIEIQGKALEFYADEKSWDNDNRSNFKDEILGDLQEFRRPKSIYIGGKRAREALTAVDGILGEV